MKSNSTKDPQLSREAWLEHSLRVLRDEGIQGVRIERLARDLGVTKGSFYWHFTDRNDLFTSLLEYWIRQYNDVVTKNPHFLENEPAAGLLEAMIKVRKEELDQYELAIRSWADHDLQVNKAIKKVYLQRKKFIRGFFTRLGLGEADVEIRARLVLCYLSWEPSMYEDESESRRLAILKRLHAFVTRK